MRPPTAWRWSWIVLLVGVCAVFLPEAAAQSIQEVRVRWQAYSGPPPRAVVPGTEQALNVFTLVERRRVAGRVKRQRSPEFSANQIAVVAVDDQGQVVDWQLVGDPRIIRAELPGPTGELQGQVLHRTEAEFLITLPDEPAIKAIRLYHPRWVGTSYVLDPVGTVPLP